MIVNLSQRFIGRHCWTKTRGFGSCYYTRNGTGERGGKKGNLRTRNGTGREEAKIRQKNWSERNLRSRGGDNGARLPAAATGRWNAPSTSREEVLRDEGMVERAYWRRQQW
jgi:hypothetical protein